MQVEQAPSMLQTDSASGTGGNDKPEVDETVMDVAPPQPPPLQHPALPFVHDVLGTHHWGSGHHLMDTGQDNQQQNEAEMQPLQQDNHGK